MESANTRENCRLCDFFRNEASVASVVGSASHTESSLAVLNSHAARWLIVTVTRNVCAGLEAIHGFGDFRNLRTGGLDWAVASLDGRLLVATLCLVLLDRLVVI